MKYAQRVILFFLLAAPIFAKADGKPASLVVLGITLGESTLFEVLEILGPADGVYLPSQELEEPESKPDDALFAVFRLDSSEHYGRVQLTVVFRKERLIASSCFLDFLDASGSARVISLQDLEKILGAKPRIVHHDLTFGPAGLEGTLSECDVGDGEFETWVFEAQGVHAYPEMEEGEAQGVHGIVFSEEIFSGKRNFPPCK